MPASNVSRLPRGSRLPTTPRVQRKLARYNNLGNAMEAEMLSDWNSRANAVVVSTRFGPLNEITVLFDDKALTFPMPPAATLTDLAQRLAVEGGPRQQMLSVTIKLGGSMSVRRRS